MEPSWGNASGGAQTLWQGTDVWRAAGVHGVGAGAYSGGGHVVANAGDLGAGRGEASHADASAQKASPSHVDPAAGLSSTRGFPPAAGLPSATNGPGWAPDRLAMEVGYGIALPGGSQVKPFGRWSREGPAGHRLNVGTRWALLGGETAGEQLPATTGLRFSMDLFGEHVANGSRPPERRVGLLGRIAFE